MLSNIINKSFNEDFKSFSKKIPDNSIDLVFTDPPYKTIKGGGHTKNNSKWTNSILEENNGKIFKFNNIKPSEYIPEIYRMLKKDSDFYIMVNDLNLHDMMTECNKYFKYHGLLIWEKNLAIMNRWYMKNCEYTLYYYKGKAKTINNPSSKKIHKFDSPKNKIHPTQKPVELVSFYIKNSTNVGDVVLDPFMGSHTTAIAAIESGRQYVGCEVDKEHWENGNKRIQGYATKNNFTLKQKTFI